MSGRSSLEEAKSGGRRRFVEGMSVKTQKKEARPIHAWYMYMTILFLRPRVTHRGFPKRRGRE
jgi:hypothetical protein